MFLAGHPFFISPDTLLNMTIDDILWWQELAIKRLEIEKDAAK